MLSQLTLVLLCFLPSLPAALRSPAATPRSEALSKYPNPSSTTPPYLHDLLRRQTASPQRTLLAAPDPTCGYFGGVSDRPWGCDRGNCVFATPTPIANISLSAGPGSVLCCDTSTGCPSSPAPTACVDNYQHGVTGSMSGSIDPMTLTCTSGLYIFCNTLTFATPSISAYFCNYVSNTVLLNATTTYAGQTAHSFTPTIPVFAVSTMPTSSSSLSQATSSSKPSPPPPAAAANTGDKKVKKSAIIGGVIGGVVGLALLTALVVWFLRGREAEGEDAAEESEEVIVDPKSRA